MLFACAACVPAFADDSTETFWDGRFECMVLGDKGEASIIDYKGDPFTIDVTKELVFPEIVKYKDQELKVTCIATENLPDKSYIPEIFVIPDCVETIGESAFESSRRGKDIEFGAGVTWIDRKACFGWDGTVHIKAANPPYVGDDAFLRIHQGTTYFESVPYIFVPKESLGQYRMSEYWNPYKDNLFAIGSFNFVEADNFHSTDGIAVEKEFKTHTRFINDTGTEVKSFYVTSSDESILSVSNFYTEYNYGYFYLKSHSEPGIVDITLSVETTDGSVYERKYEVEVYADTNSVEGIDAENGRATVYDLNGRAISESPENLMPGIYIIKEGKTTKKVAVK